MSEEAALIAEMTARVFAQHCNVSLRDAAEKGAWASKLWDELEEMGVARAAVTESPNEPDYAVLASIIRTAGQFAAPLPLQETFLAQMQLQSAGLFCPAGPLTVAPVLNDQSLTLRRVRNGWTVSGRLRRIPWARHTVGIAALVEEADGVRTCLLEPLVVSHGYNLAREPRDDLEFSDVPVPNDNVGEARRGWDCRELRASGAFLRAVAMSGALERTLELTVDYATTRVQFGRPIAKFQAVQQQIAVLASHVAAARAVTEACVSASSRQSRQFAIAAAKARVGEAATAVSEIAHQVHGAIGFTHEHSLHRSTRRLLAWREEFGSDAEWAIWIGRIACAEGGEGLWPMLTNSRKILSDTRDFI